MAIPDASTVAQRWAQNAAAAAPRYVQGAEQTSKDPTALAIAALPKYMQRVQEAYQSGRTQRGLQRAGKAGWLAGVTGKGAMNYSNGVSASQGKFAERIAPVLAYEATLQGQINNMPNLTLQDSINRATAWIQGMAAYKTNR